MYKKNKLVKATLLTAAFALVGTTAPLAGQAYAGGPQIEEQEPRAEEPQQSQEEQPAEQQQPEANKSFGDKIIETGEKYMGVPYKLGAEYPDSGKFDCSSFTQYVFAKNGVKLPRTAEPQAEVGQEVPRSQLQKGDLVFFKLKGREHLGIEHVGIYAGDGKILHTWGPGGVRYDEMSDRWLDWGFVKATRVQP